MILGFEKVKTLGLPRYKCTTCGSGRSMLAKNVRGHLKSEGHKKKEAERDTLVELLENSGHGRYHQNFSNSLTNIGPHSHDNPDSSDEEGFVEVRRGEDAYSDDSSDTLHLDERDIADFEEESDEEREEPCEMNLDDLIDDAFQSSQVTDENSANLRRDSEVMMPSTSFMWHPFPNKEVSAL
jgi:hypothetical protein